MIMHNEWGPVGMDTRHNISVTGVYELPFGRGKRFGSNMNAIVNEAVGGWRVSGAQVYYSGFPITASSPANYSTQVDAFTGAARPNLLRPFHATNKSINAYFGTEVQPIIQADGTSVPAYWTSTIPLMTVALHLPTTIRLCLRRIASRFPPWSQLPEHRYVRLQDLPGMARTASRFPR